MTQKEWKIKIQSIIKTNDKALYRSILIIYNLQTEDEKKGHITTGTNHIGFGKVDADILTNYAIKLINKINLTPAEKAISRNKMCKYWRQLMLVSKKELPNYFN